MVPANTVYSYRIDRDDRIRYVSPEWVEFAEENDAKDLQPDAVVGRVLWRFIAGDETQYVYRVLFSNIRKDRRTRAVPFRCDGPLIRRFMELAVSASDEGGLELTGVLLREEPRDAMALLDARTPRTGELLAMCAWCKRVSVKGEWLEVERAIVDLGLFDDSHLPQITHGICQDCSRAVRESG
jgi:hypothetical protein